MKCTAIVLAGGKGKRMGSETAKQYMELGSHPVLYYSLKAFQDSFIDEIILVAGGEAVEYCKREIVEKYGLDKVKAVVQGGKERYHSVAAGLHAASDDTDYVFIHDAARPYLTAAILDRALETVREYGTAITSVAAKDTIKIADDDGFVVSTPNRASVYIMQTPQVFEFLPIKEAYEKLIAHEAAVIADGIQITDDAMVMEQFGNLRIKLSEGDYRNIKLTTPEDLEIMKRYLIG